ncbi:O-antigen ligase family protein [Glutamicibacter soli]
MMPRSFGGSRVASGALRSPRASGWPTRNASWPLLVFFFSFPLWWLLGLSTFGFLAVGGLLAYYLLKLPSIKVPPGFIYWSLFLGVAFIGVLTLWVPVPGLMSESGPSRILSWAFRILWMLAATAVMLFIGNSSRRLLPDRALVLALGSLFMYTVMGGYAGIFLSELDFPSVLEILLPKSISSVTFVQSQIHPGLAQVQDILGYDSPRPMAPFDYANSWGANFGILLPFYLLSFRYATKPVARTLLWFGLLASIPPAVLSLNRAMWLGLIAMGLFMLIRLALSGRFMALATTLFAALGGALVLLYTPLWDIVETRLENPHSNSGRTNLAEYTIQVVLEHSPIIGFGSTRTRQGNFFSIAAGATADCHQCNPPQLGTQGSLWFLIFCTGILGTILFFVFFTKHFGPVLRARHPVHRTMIYPAIFYLCVLPTYDIMTTSLFLLMIAVGISWRHAANPDNELTMKGLGNQ